MKKFGIVLVLLALIGAGAWWAYGRLQQDISIDVSANELAAKITPLFPLKKCAIVCIEFSNPQIALPAGADKVDVSTTLRASLGPLEFPGKARLTAKPRYDAASASVFLSDVAIPEISLTGVPENVTALVQQHGPILANVALAQTPVYRVADAGTLGEIAKRGMTNMQVVDGKLRLTFRVLSDKK